jgi:hypothetical protein
MTIANCDYPYALYNSTFQGLATLSPSSAWDYDTNVRIWLASFSPGWKAVTLWGNQLASASSSDSARNRDHVGVTDGGSITVHVLQRNESGGGSLPISVSEGDETVELFVDKHGSYPGQMPFAVDYRVVDGSAKDNQDFHAISEGTLTWYDGEYRAFGLSIEIIDDEIGEQSESFQFELLNPSPVPSGWTVKLQGATVTIVDDDASGGDGSRGGGGGSVSWATQVALLTLLLICRRRIRRAN